MTAPKALQSILPEKLYSYLKSGYERLKNAKELNREKVTPCDVSNLRTKDFMLKDILSPPETEKQWFDFKKEIDQFIIPDNTGGINQGDRRAIYYLINTLVPERVLEVGTHLGASTTVIAAALRNNAIKHNLSVSLTTVDIADVNSGIKKPWLNYGSSHAPMEMIQKLHCDSFTRFVISDSVAYLSGCKEKYDLIFLDGNHSAVSVYNEVPLALKLLNPNGVILLHDYFPKMKPLWSDGVVIPGPYLAIKRFTGEKVNFSVLEFGELPWPTKLESNFTSLALLLRKS